jgi:hypothetical protein
MNHAASSTHAQFDVGVVPGYTAPPSMGRGFPFGEPGNR